jgi:hypothetical protein
MTAPDHSVVVEDDRVVGLDESHAAHVRRQVEDMVAPSHHLFAVVKHPQIHEVKLVAEDLLLWYMTASIKPRKRCSARNPRRIECTRCAVSQAASAFSALPRTGMCSLRFQSTPIT